MSEGEQSDARKRAFDTDLSVEERMEALAEDPPKDPKDWPDDRDMRNATFGGADGGDEGYDDGLTRSLGPSEVRHHEDGSVSVAGEKVDNPDDYKGESVTSDVIEQADKTAASPTDKSTGADDD